MLCYINTDLKCDPSLISELVKQGSSLDFFQLIAAQNAVAAQLEEDWLDTYTHHLEMKEQQRREKEAEWFEYKLSKFREKKEKEKSIRRVSKVL